LNHNTEPKDAITSPRGPHRALSLVVFFTALWFIFLKMLSEPTFFDGITYGAVAQNLATASQGYWNLSYTATIFPSFVEHPPFFLWLLHLTFFLPQLPFPPEFCLNFFLLIATLILIQKLWISVQHNDAPTFSAWIPLSLFLITPILRESFSSALIDNLLCLFNLLTVLLLLNCGKASRKKIVISYGMISVITFFAVLSKGPVGLYPLLACGLTPIFFPHASFRWIGLWLPLTVCGLLIGVLCLNDNAYTYLSHYFHKQVLASLFGTRSHATVVGWGHFYVLKVLFSRELIPMIFCGLAGTVIYKIRPIGTPLQTRAVLFFLLLGIAGITPLMVTAKQWSFYVVPALPFFILGVSFYVKEVFQDIAQRIWQQKLLWRLTALVFILGIGFWTSHKTQTRNIQNPYWQQWQIFFESVPADSTLTACEPLRRKFALHAYAKRFGHINIHLQDAQSDFHITHPICETPDKAILVAKGPHGYLLWKKRVGITH
jgi:hypothetical protein